MTFTHPEFVEFTVYEGGSYELSDGQDLTAEQATAYEQWVSKVAVDFDFSDAVDPDNACLVLTVKNGEVRAEYWKGEDDEDALNPAVDELTL